jgi:hypothetical protein
VGQGSGLWISLSELILELTWLETLENFSSVGSFFDAPMIEFIISWDLVSARGGRNGIRSLRFDPTNFLLLALYWLILCSEVVFGI